MIGRIANFRLRKDYNVGFSTIKELPDTCADRFSCIRGGVSRSDSGVL